MIKHPLRDPLADLVHDPGRQGHGTGAGFGEEMPDTGDDFQKDVGVARIAEGLAGGLEVLVGVHHFVFPGKKQVGRAFEASESRQGIVAQEGA